MENNKDMTAWDYAEDYKKTGTTITINDGRICDEKAKEDGRD